MSAESDKTPASSATPAPETPRPDNAPPPPPPRKRPWGWKLLAAVGWIACLFCFAGWMYMLGLRTEYYDTSQGVMEQYHSGAREGTDKIAVLNISGVILDGDGYAKAQIDRIREDPSVKAVVIRVDSPGGSVSASDYIFHHLQKLREERDIPLVVSMGGIAASGGYYVSMAVDDKEEFATIFAEPTTTTGSIGVIVPHYDLTGLLEQHHVQDDSIVSGPHKQMLSMTRPISPEDREILQTYVDLAFARFKEVIMEGRPYFKQHPEKLDALATGQIYTSGQALDLGLVDKIGFLEEAISEASKIAGLKESDVRVISYSKPMTLTAWVGLAEQPRGMDLTQILEMSTPRAFYLYSSLPVAAKR